MSKLILVITFFLTLTLSLAKVEHVPVVNPVYDFLLRAETRGFLENRSLSQLPLQRQTIIDILLEMKNDDTISDADKEIVDFYLREFNGEIEDNTVLFESKSESDQILFDGILSEKDKYFYKNNDSNSSVNIKPLLKSDIYLTNSDDFDNKYSVIGQGGFRLFGNIENLGYFLQATNGSDFAGSRNLAINRSRELSRNIKFFNLESDVDLTESHLRYQSDWFYAIIGRETRLLGAGINQNIFISNYSPPFDAISLGARFNEFEYRFTHGSLLGIPTDNVGQGFNAAIPDKYITMHRFAVRPDWGEISFWEGVIYSERFIDIAYLNPLSFLKSLEHALRDRDNSLMGFDFTVRPTTGLQIKGSFLLDDIIFDRIGTGFWSNKTAWNIAGIYSFRSPFDIGVEYSRVEPYTYSHFNPQNSYSNDQLPLGSRILPNSDYLTVFTNYWWGGKYPLRIKVSRVRHGENIIEDGELVKNVGGSVLQTRRPEDSETVTFLDGNLIDVLNFEFSAGVEIFRNFNARLFYNYETNDFSQHYLRLLFTLEDF